MTTLRRGSRLRPALCDDNAGIAHAGDLRRSLPIRLSPIRTLDRRGLPGVGSLSLWRLPRLDHLSRVAVRGGSRLLLPFDGSAPLRNRSCYSRRSLARGAAPAVARFGPALFGPSLSLPAVAASLALTAF
jgi:hypothetical protein